MIISLRPIFAKVIIFLMTFLLGLPCAVKKDLKQVLNIAVSDLQQTEKPNKSIICPSYSVTEGTRNSVSHQKKEVKRFDCDFSGIIYLSEVSDCDRTPFSNVHFVTAIPLYILHEQYLI